MPPAILHFLRPDDDTGSDCLSEDERARVDRFMFPEDARRWRNYRAALRRVLASHLGIGPADVTFVKEPNGKPGLASPHRHLHFNLSHADDLAVVIVSEEGPVGIDLEPWSRAGTLIDCADAFCHPVELRSLPADLEQRARRLLEIWTGKEALLKALGTGLSYPPQAVRIDRDRGIADQPLDGVEGFRLITPRHSHSDDHRVAVAARDTTEIVVADVSD